MSRVVFDALELKIDELERCAGFGKVAVAEEALKIAMAVMRDILNRIEGLERGTSMQLALDVMERVQALEGRLNDG